MIGFDDFVLLLTILIILGTVYTAIYNSKILRIDDGQIFSFKESLDLAGLPVITLQQGNNKLNFLLDTGSNVSYINGTTIVEVTKTGDKDSCIGAEGVSKDCELGNAELCYMNKKYTHVFRIVDLGAAFSQVKASTGVTLNGIIGNDFMEKYKYCIDFKEYLVYRRK